MKLDSVTIDRVEARETAADYRRVAKQTRDPNVARELEEMARAFGAAAAAEDTPLIALTPTITRGGSQVRTLVQSRGGNDESRQHFLLPNIAVCKADARFCYSRGVERDGSVAFVDTIGRRSSRQPNGYRKGRVKTRPGAFELPTGFEEGSEVNDWLWPRNGCWGAMVPVVPPKHRPARAGSLASYLVLWEVERWTWQKPPAPPVDPALLKHVVGDVYAVLAVWDLSELERMVLEGRNGP